MNGGAAAAASTARTQGRGRRRTAFTGLVVLFAVLAPIAVVVLLSGQLQQTGEVSHWPWEEHGVFGWWLIPLSFWIAAACSIARSRRRSPSRLSAVLLAVAAVTSLLLLYNP